MDIGMLWHCEKPKMSLEENVAQAADYYASKYGQRPNCAHVHPSMLPPDGAAVIVGVIRVQANRTVLKNHLWLGVDQAEV